MPALCLYIPRTALPGAASTASSPLLLQLVSGTTSRASSSYIRSPSHQYRRLLALQLSPPQLHIRRLPPLRCILPPLGCRRHAVGVSRGCGWGWVQERRIAATALMRAKAVKKTHYPPRPKVDEKEIEEKYLKGSGPGGQKINKTSSAVQLRHIPTGIVVKSQATRSREQNRKIARRILAEKLEQLEKGSESRAAVLQREESRRRRSKEKKARRKYAKLAAGRDVGAVASRAGAGVGGPSEDNDIGDLEGEGGEWVVADEAFEDDGSDSDSDSDSESSDSDSDSDSSDSRSDSGKPHSRGKRHPPPQKTGEVELAPEMSFEEEQEFLRLSREFAIQLQEEEAKREAVELKWRSGGGE